MLISESEASVFFFLEFKMRKQWLSVRLFMLWRRIIEEAYNLLIKLSARIFFFYNWEALICG
jgi:hypothetical protein